jgi:microtubule-associated protein-like 6
MAARAPPAGAGAAGSGALPPGILAVGVADLSEAQAEAAAGAGAPKPKDKRSGEGVGGGAAAGGAAVLAPGSVVLLDAATLAQTQVIRDTAKPVYALQWSSDGKRLAVGAGDSKLYVYDAKVDGDGYAAKSTFAKHSSAVKAVDFSTDGALVQSESAGHEVLVAEASTGAAVTRSAADLAAAGTQWETYTLMKGKAVEGVWPPHADGSDINAVAVQVYAVEGAPAGAPNALVATADDFGDVKVFLFPCTGKDAAFVKGVAHSSHVTNVKFSVDGKFLLSTGGHDCAVMQWKVIPLAPEPKGGAVVLLSGDAGGGGAASGEVRDATNSAACSVC